MVTVKQARRRLTLLWTGSSAILILLVLVMTLAHREISGQAEAAWGWLLPAIIPTLTLVLGVNTITPAAPETSDSPVDGTLFWRAFGTSSFYLVVVCAFIFVPVALAGGRTFLDHAAGSQLILAPLQGFVAMTVGIFFKGEVAAHAAPPLGKT